MKAIIFAGGSGTRLWPLSRKNTPKQFMNIVQNKTMLQMCVDRLVPGFDMDDIYISTGVDFVAEVKEQLTSIRDKNIIAEPAPRDVGPAVGLVTALFAKTAPDEPIVLLWGSDHLIKKEGLFRRILKAVGDIVRDKKNTIILIGQTPRYASENVGWIELGEPVIKKNDVSFRKLNGFRYRPNKALAEGYLRGKNHAWNLGYFVTTPSFLWSQFKKYAPKLAADLTLIQKAYGTAKFDQVLNEVYPKIEKISFDNAVMEKMSYEHGLVVAADLGWSDVGAWEALKEALQTSRQANVTQGTVILQDSEDSLIYNYEKSKTVVGIDLEDFLVVNTPDVLLVTKKSSVPKIKKLVESMEGTELEKLT